MAEALHVEQRIDVQAPGNELVEDHHPHTGFLSCTDGQYSIYIVCSIASWFELHRGSGIV